ncbi:IS6 family transposase [Roseovarius sp. MBR-78]|uniref:IS6 family transposase n=1 Tax=Roseovarius sp. MBR-78 TaxID=3156460 RepID=UPI00339AA7F0
MQIPSSMPRLKGFRFPREIVAYAVWAYHRFALRTADVEDLLAARGVIVRREAIRLWVHRSGAHFAACIRRDRLRLSHKWHLDEVVIQMGGVKHWLWRAVDGEEDLDLIRGIKSPTNGDTLDILVQTRRNAKAAKRFLTRLIAQFGQPRVVITDKLRSYTKPISRLAPRAAHRAHKGLDNRIEGRHRLTRRSEKIMGRFKSPRQAQRFLAAHDQINTIFKPRRYRLTATSCRHARADAFDLWTNYALQVKP